MGITRYCLLLTTLLKMRGTTRSIGSCRSLVACTDPPKGGWLLVENNYIQQAVGAYQGNLRYVPRKDLCFLYEAHGGNLKKAFNDTILRISLWTMLTFYSVRLWRQLTQCRDWVMAEWQTTKKLVKHIFLQKIYHYNISESYSNVLKGARVCYHNPCGAHLLEDDRMIRDLSYEWITFSISPDSLSTCICDEDDELM